MGLLDSLFSGLTKVGHEAVFSSARQQADVAINYIKSNDWSHRDEAFNKLNRCLDCFRQCVAEGLHVRESQEQIRRIEDFLRYNHN